MADEWVDIGAAWLKEDGENLSVKMNGWNKSASMRKNTFKKPGESTPDYRIRTNDPDLIAQFGRRDSQSKPQAAQDMREAFASGTSDGMDQVPF